MFCSCYLVKNYKTKRFKNKTFLALFYLLFAKNKTPQALKLAGIVMVF